MVASGSNEMTSGCNESTSSSNEMADASNERASSCKGCNEVATESVMFKGSEVEVLKS